MNRNQSGWMPHLHAGLVFLVFLGGKEEIAAVYQAETIAVAKGFRGFGPGRE